MIGPSMDGVGRCVLSLIGELTRQGRVADVVALAPTPVPDALRTCGAAVIETDFTRADRRYDRRWTWERKRLRGWIASANVDVLHATWNSGVPDRLPVPAVLTLHDLIPLHEPRRCFASRAERRGYVQAVRRSARNARIIVTVSEFVRRDAIERLGLPADKVVTIHNGVNVPDTAWNAATAPTNGRAYVLNVGGFAPRKNVAAVLAAMEKYWANYGPEVELRLAGNPETMPAALLQAVRRAEQQGPVSLIGTVPDDELAYLYAGASALVILSTDEGFGLPALEAMAHGCPVIAADRASLPEVVAEAGILVDPDSPNAVAAALHELLAAPTRRNELIDWGRQRAAGLTWARNAERVRKIYAKSSGIPSLPSREPPGICPTALTRRPGGG